MRQIYVAEINRYSYKFISAQFPYYDLEIKYLIVAYACYVDVRYSQ